MCCKKERGRERFYPKSLRARGAHGGRKIKCPEGRLETAIAFAAAPFVAIPAVMPVSAIVAFPAVAVMTGTTSVAPAIITAAASTPAAAVAATAGRTTASTTSTATRGAAIFGLADAQAPAAEVGSVELGDRGFSHLATGESDEGEPALTTRFPVERHV